MQKFYKHLNNVEKAMENISDAIFLLNKANEMLDDNSELENQYSLIYYEETLEDLRAAGTGLQEDILSVKYNKAFNRQEYDKFLEGKENE